MIKERNRKMLETFMRNVTWLRKQHGLSKKHMAQILGIGVGSLNKIENGQMPQRLGVEILERIYIHFGVIPQEQLVKDLGLSGSAPGETDSSQS